MGLGPGDTEYPSTALTCFPDLCACWRTSATRCLVTAMPLHMPACQGTFEARTRKEENESRQTERLLRQMHSTLLSSYYMVTFNCHYYSEMCVSLYSSNNTGTETQRVRNLSKASHKEEMEGEKC